MSTKDAMLHIRVKSGTLDKVKAECQRLGVTQSEYCLSAILSALGEDVESPSIDSLMARVKRIEDFISKSEA